MDRFLSIEAFVDVAETRSFAETARRMRLSKSVITTRIQQLEAYVGAPLFHRNTRSVQLSEVGLVFVRQCAELVTRTDELVEQIPSEQVRRIYTDLAVIDIERSGAIMREMVDGLSFGRLCELTGVPLSADPAMKVLA